jgi:hypothetical protein
LQERCLGNSCKNGYFENELISVKVWGFMYKMEQIKKKQTIQILLVCGIISSFIYILADILLGLSWKGYSFFSQAVSELSAIGAPTRLSWNIMSFFYIPLVVAFGIGVWKSSENKLFLKVTGILLSIWGLLGYVWFFFPMHMRGQIVSSTTDTMHLVLAGITVPLMIVFIAVGSGVKDKYFRIYSILTIVATLVCGAFTAMDAPKVAAQLPTPWMGILERVSVYAPMIWVAMLAVVLLKTKKNTK